MKIFLLSLVIVVFIAGSPAFPICPQGDLDNDCKVNWEDIRAFTEQWLDSGECEDLVCADFDGLNGIDFADFAFLANYWQSCGIPLVVNEFMASNSSASGIHDLEGEYDDWIEIYNFGDTPINLAGMYLTDDLDNPTKWRVPLGYAVQTTVPAYGFVVIWADEDTQDGPLHADFKLSAGGEDVGLFDTDGNTPIDTLSFGGQTTNVSYGRYPDASDNWRFFSTPTAGAENNGAYAGEIEEVEFSHTRGFYDTPFSVIIATTTAGADIYYTVDGNAPFDVKMGVPASGATKYTAPVTINTTTCLRAVGFKTAWKPTNMDAQTYIFPAHVIVQSQQAVLNAGYPSSWSGYPADYEMDPEICQPPSPYAGLVKGSLLAIPTMSIATDKKNLFDPSTGIYTNPLNSGINWERPVSVEFFDPNGSKEFQINCGLCLQGGASRQPVKSPKHSFSLRFRGEYGTTRLEYPLFGEDWPVDSFNELQLRGGFNNAWTHWDSAQRLRSQYIRDHWARDSMLDMGQFDAGGGISIHLYINGMYWGVYMLHERVDADHYADYHGGNADEIDATNGDPTYTGTEPGQISDGTIDAWLELQDVVAARDWERICEQLDVDSFIDWTIMNYYAGATDIKRGNNWRSAGGGPYRRPWHIYSWDAEKIFESPTTTTIGQVTDPTGFFIYLDDIEEFRVHFGDRVHKHLFDGGALTVDNSRNRWLRRSDEVELAIIAESARWGDYRRDVHQYLNGPYYLYNKNDHWIPEKNNLLNNYFPVRTSVTFSAFRNMGMYPSIDAPVFYINGSPQHGGQVPINAPLSMSVPAGTAYYTTDGNDPRLPTTSQATLFVYVPENAAKKVLVPTTDIGTTWKGANEPFDDSAWTHGTFVSGKTGGVGYDRNTGDINYLPYISYNVESLMYNTMTSCYIRISFSITSEDLAKLNSLMLNVRCDDGFVACINGQEVASINKPTLLLWNSSCANRTNSVDFVAFDITNKISALHAGNNILAIHALNTSTTSSDFLISVELTAGSVAGGVSPTAIQYAGPFTLDKSTNLKARIYKSSTGEWSALNEAVYEVGNVRNSLRITEIMYNPQDTGEPNDEDTEYVELKNIGGITINLNLVKFDKGIDFIFGTNALAAGRHILVVKDCNAFEAKYGKGRNIAGHYSGSLNNGGERVRLLDALGAAILDFDYKDGWRSITDGNGYSLTIINPTNPDANSWQYKDSWRASAYVNGSPGWDDSGIIPNPGAIVINEIMAHSHAGAPDWIELYNTTASPINIGGWYISDNDSNLMKYRFAAGTTIPTNGYIVLYEDVNFGQSAGDPGRLAPFALSENGELVCLTSALDANSFLTGYREKEDFGASETGVSFGRYYKASTNSYNFVPMDHNTPGYANAYPKIGPIVITEIMYHPDWPAGGTYANDEYEYIELCNTSAAAVTLYDYAEGMPWKFTDGIEYTFAGMPSVVTIPAGGRILVVKNPTAFCSRYPGVPVGIIYGPYDGWLANEGEQLEIGKPGDIDGFGTRQYIRVERVNYSDGSHPGDDPQKVDIWPKDADGKGKSLTRISTTLYGNDPNNWQAGTPTPGL